MHLPDAFIQSNLQYIQVIHFHQYVCSLGIEPTTFCTADAMLHHRATQEHIIHNILNMRMSDYLCWFKTSYRCVNVSTQQVLILQHRPNIEPILIKDIKNKNIFWEVTCSIFMNGHSRLFYKWTVTHTEMSNPMCRIHASCTQCRFFPL